MSSIDIIRAWKDEDYRNSLSAEQRSQLPENPAGMIELSDTDLEACAGGYQKLISGTACSEACSWQSQCTMNCTAGCLV